MSERLAKEIGRLNAHDHLCLIYSTPEEQMAAALPFIHQGLQRGEKCLYITDDKTASHMKKALGNRGINVSSAVSSGALTFSTIGKTYLRRGRFDPDDIIKLFKRSTNAAKAGGYRALRVIGDMSWLLEGSVDFDAIAAYESMVDSFSSDNDALAMCQYDCERFPSELIRALIFCHPSLIYKNTLVKNPYYMMPEVFMSQGRSAHETQLLLKNLLENRRSMIELSENRNKLEATIKSIDDLISTIDGDLKITWANDAAKRVFGDDIIGKKCYRAYHNRKRRCKDCIAIKTFKDGKIHWHVHEAIDRNGNKLLYHCTTSIFHREDDPKSVIHVSRDLTEQKQTEDELRESRNFLQNVMNSMAEPIMVIGLDYNVRLMNRAAKKLLRCRTRNKSHISCHEISHRNNKKCAELGLPCPMEQVRDTGQAVTVVHEHCDGTGKVRIYEISATPWLSSHGSFRGIIEVSRDITEQKQSERKMQMVNRALMLLGRCSSLIQAAANEKDLLLNTCMILVEECGYRLAWVGFAEDDAAKTVRPVAQAGFEDGYLETVNITWADTQQGHGPTGTAIRSGKPSVCRNILFDPSFAPWRDEAIKRGYASSISIPLISEAKTFGALNVYAHEHDAFNHEETGLLLEAAHHIASGVRALRAKEERKLAFEQLKKSEARLRKAQEIASLGNWSWDTVNNELYWSDEIYRIFGLEPQEFGADYEAFLNSVHPDDREFVNESVLEALYEGKPYSIDHRIVLPDGTERIVHEQAEVVFDESGSPVRMDGTIQDITQRKRAEEELIASRKKAEEEVHITSALLEFSRSVSGLLEIRAICNIVARTLIGLTFSEKTAVFLRSNHTGDFAAEAFQGFDVHLATLISSLRISEGEMPAVERVLRGESVCIDDASQTDLIEAALVENFNLRALAIYPILIGKGVIGALVAERKFPYSERERELIEGVAAIASTAIENAYLYKESLEMSTDLARRIETVETTYTIDRAILSSLNREDILEVVTVNIQRIIPADKIIAVLFDEENRVYRFGSETVAYGTCFLLDSVLRTGRVTSVPDIQLYKQKVSLVDTLFREGFSSLIVLPILSRDKRIGCIVMAGKRIGAFDREDIANAEKLTAQMSIALENEKLYTDIKDLFMATVRTLTHTIDAKSPWTSGHSERVTAYAVALGREISLTGDELEKLELAGLLHDIGKIGTLDQLLDKPDMLNEEEFAMVMQHPAKGAEILKHIKQMKDIIPAIKHHHEKYSGSGYPDDLKGNAIPLPARILCIADSFDSMTADRPYRLAPGKEYAISELRRCAGTQFDPELARAFIGLIEANKIKVPP